MPTIITDGAASAQGYGFAARTTAANYIEDVFSTYLYTGSDSAQSISNGIDLATKGGMVWIKNRPNVTDHYIVDSSRISGGDYGMLNSNSTAAQSFQAGVSSFDSGGFSLDGNVTQANRGGYGSYASWTFRKQAKFFDVVTYTGNGTANRAIAHNLTSTPGAIFIKRTDSARNWAVYHRSTTAYDYSLRLNTTDAQAQDNYFSAAPDASYFYIDKSPGGDLNVNANGGTYVAYLFAHDAGGFGASGSDNVISCGSFTTGGTGAATVTLGYEPQWVMIKQTNAANNWIILDTMRGWATGNNDDMRLNPNLSVAESSDELGFPTATGFQASGFGLNQTWIYIAIRRGPMKTPTSGTSVFDIDTASSYAANELIPTSFPPDISINKSRITANSWYLPSRLTGGYLIPNSTAAEVAGVWKWDGVAGQSYATSVYTDIPIYYSFRRAPGFFDVVCYRGNGVDGRTINHNLTVSPELTIIKMRSGSTTRGWRTYTPGAIGSLKYGMLDLTNAFESAPYIPSVSSTTVTLSTDQEVNGNNNLYVAYLFATVAGVSKVGSYTGSGTTKQIDCGFTGGARFVLIKRTDSTGDWYVWDSARGIVAGNDPYLLLNSAAAEVTGTDYVDTYAAGFEISSTAPAAINANGGSFIFLAIS